MKIILVAHEPAHCEFMSGLIPHFLKLGIKVSEFFFDGDWVISEETLKFLYEQLSSPNEKKVAVLSGMCFGNERHGEIDPPPYEYEAICRASMLQIPFGFYGEYWPNGNWTGRYWFTRFLDEARVFIGPDWCEKSTPLMGLIKKSYPRSDFALVGTPAGTAEMLAYTLLGPTL